MAAATFSNVSGFFCTVAFMPFSLAQHHVVAMHQLGAAGMAEDGGDLAALLADDTRCVAACIGDEAAAKLTAVGGADDDGVAALERAFHALHAGRQQALAGQQRLLRAGIDLHDALGLELPRDPALARRDRIGGRQEPGAGRALRRARAGDA